MFRPNFGCPSSPERLAADVECFAKHAKRRSVTVDDVLLTARRNSSLV
jgi:histone H3/H4